MKKVAKGLQKREKVTTGEKPVLTYVWGIAGHERVTDYLEHMIERSGIAHGCLFIGPRSIGKGALIHTLARIILCTSAYQRPCGHCASCEAIAKGTHPDVASLDGEQSESVGIDTLRAVLSRLQTRPVVSDRSVVLLENLDKLSQAASHALLKTLEEPPAYAHLLITVSSEEAILPTIASRCQTFFLHPTNDEEMKSYLRAHSVGSHHLHRISAIAQGRIGVAHALVSHPETLEAFEHYAHILSSAFTSAHAQRFSSLEYLLPKGSTALEERESVSRALECWMVLLREAIYAHTGATLHPSPSATATTLASRSSLEKLTQLLRQCLVSRDLLLKHVQPRLVAESLFLTV